MTLRLALLALTASASALAQPAPDIVGTWELEAAENVPTDDELVFARVTLSDDEIHNLFVFRNPDDGRLDGRRRRGRYIVSDGQLIVRETNGVTVLDVVRVADRLTLRDLETGVVLRLREVAPGGDIDPALLGDWAGVRDGQPWVLRFRPDGDADMGDPDDLNGEAWAAAGDYVLLDNVPFLYAIAEDADGRRTLTVEGDGFRVVLRRDGDD